MRLSKLRNTLLILPISLLYFAPLANAQVSGPGSSECSGTPDVITVSSSCVFGTFNNSDNGTGQTVNASCAGGYGSAYEDVWYTLTGTGNGITVAIEGTDRDCVLAVYTGCGTGEISCLTIDQGVAASLLFASISGVTYYIQIQRRSGNNAQNLSGSICASHVPPPANDLPCGAQSLAVGSSCNMSIYSNLSATDSGITDPGCGDYQGGDVWFSATVPASGELTIDTDDNLAITNSGMAVYTGTCGALTFVECDDDDSGNGLMSMIQLTGLTPGSTIFIRFWEKGNNVNGRFSICAYDGNPPPLVCGNPANNDWCESPATLVQGPGTWSSSTSPIYTSDLPGNSGSIFCGTVENNSWYQFTALNFTEVFDFTYVGNCANNSGIQAQVFDISNNAMGCCDVFSSVSNCWNPGAVQPGTVTATGLTIGQTYVLMVDGYAGDQCDFTVSNWTATGIFLPVELAQFSGVAKPDKNVLTWKTISENNNDRFEVMRSFDRQKWELAGTVKGAGTSTEVLDYSFYDYSIRSGDVLYKIVQFDVSSSSTETEAININRAGLESGIVNAYPNPVKTLLTAEVNSLDDQGGVIDLVQINGQVVASQIIETKGTYLIKFSVEELKDGMYFLVYRDSLTNSTKKFIKE